MPSSFLKNFLVFLALAALLWVGGRYLLPIAMPFLLAAALALASEPLVRVFQGRLRLPRWAATGLGVTISLGLLVLCVLVLGALLLRQLQALTGVVPDLEQTALQGLQSLRTWLLDAASGAPDAISPLVTRSVEGMFSDSTAVLDRISSRLLGMASGLISKLPGSALGIGTWLLAGYMISARLPQIKTWLAAKMPAGWNEKALPMLKNLKKSILSWLTAQLKLTSVTFAVLTAGFWLLQISYSPVWAAVIALVDSLPVLGSGLVLVPWSVVCFLQGDAARAVGLLGVWAAAALLRSVLEPKLIGRQLGLDPLVTLIAMYAGYRLWGFAGMILSPLLAVTVTQVLSAPKEM